MNNIFGPSLPAAERNEFNNRPWNPRKPCDIHNPLPVEKWPFKPNAKVFFIHNKSIYAGRVTWYHPARKIDHSCCVSVGHPFFNIREADGRSFLPSASNVFPGTKKGWADAKGVVVDNLFKSIKEEERNSETRIAGIKQDISEYVARKCPV